MTNKAYVTINNVAAAAVAELSDDFPGDTLNASNWSSYSEGAGFSVGVADNELQCTLAASLAGYAGVWSVDAYDLTGGYAQVQFADTSTVDAGETNMVLVLATSTGAPQVPIEVLWLLNTDTIYAAYFPTEDGDQTLLYSAAWSSEYIYLRIREASGTTYWDSSPDGVTWTNRASISDPITLTSVYAGMYAWNYGTGNPAGQPAFSNFFLGETGATAPQVTCSAVVVAADNSVVSITGNGLPDSIAASFDYGDSEEDIREAVVAAVKAAADDDTVDVSIIA